MQCWPPQTVLKHTLLKLVRGKHILMWGLWQITQCTRISTPDCSLESFCEQRQEKLVQPRVSFAQARGEDGDVREVISI